MKIILNENVENVGSVGDVISVKDGFARNYLIPLGRARIATASNIKVVEKEKAKEIQKEKELLAQAKVVADKIRKMDLKYEANTGDEGKLFGSVTANHIQDLLSAEKIDIDKKNIRILKPIRKVGTHDVEIRCYHNVKALLKLVVEEKASEKPSKEKNQKS